MARPNSSRAGGALLAGAILLGVLAGSVVGESSVGFVGGLVVGLALMAAIWVIDRRRRR